MAIEKGTFTLPDGGTLVYEIYGTEHVDSTPLVLITGLSSVKEDWHPFSDELAKKRTVLVYDRRGIGASRLAKRTDDDDEQEHTLDLEAYDILALLASLDQKRYGRVNILGWSMGGHILQALLLLPEAKAAPADVGGVVVKGIHVEKAILTATMPKLPKADFKPSVLEPIMATAGSDPNWKQKVTEAMMVYQFDDKWLAQSPANRAILARRVKEGLATRRPQSIIAAQAAAIAMRDTRTELERIPASLPVLVIHGKLDRMVAYSESESLVKSIKGAKRLQMSPEYDDQYGHFWFDYFKVDWWAQKIEHFLRNGHQAQAKL